MGADRFVFVCERGHMVGEFDAAGDVVGVEALELSDSIQRSMTPCLYWGPRRRQMAGSDAVFGALKSMRTGR